MVQDFGQFRIDNQAQRFQMDRMHNLVKDLVSGSVIDRSIGLRDRRKTSHLRRI